METTYIKTEIGTEDDSDYQSNSENLKVSHCFFIL